MHKIFLASLLAWTLLSLSPGWVLALPAPGDILPDMVMQAPATAEETADLGIVEGQSFRLADLGKPLVLFEVIGVYCPQCYLQAPGFISIQKRLAKSGLDEKVAVMALAAGGTPMETAYLHEQGNYKMPIVPDPDYSVHKLLGEPQTPFTMVLTKDGEVLFAHLGIIEDMDAFFLALQNLAKNH